MKIGEWEIKKDARGFYAKSSELECMVRILAEGVEVTAYNCDTVIPNKVMGALESLVGCNCNPLEQTGGVHRHDCPAHQPEWEGPQY